MKGADSYYHEAMAGSKLDQGWQVAPQRVESQPTAQNTSAKRAKDDDQEWSISNDSQIMT